MFTMGAPMWGGAAAADPFSAQVVLHMLFNNTLVDEKGHPFAADGGITYVDDWLGGRAVNIGGATSGNGGSNVVYNTTSSLDFALQGDFCIEVAGRINSNITRPRTFIRVAQGSTSVASIGAESGALRADVRNGAGSTQSFSGGTYTTYGVAVHLAIVREGTAGRMYRNGELISSSAFLNYVTPNVTADVYLGNSQRFFIDAMDGEIAWARITNHARYTTAFTPPTTS